MLPLRLEDHFYSEPEDGVAITISYRHGNLCKVKRFNFFHKGLFLLDCDSDKMNESPLIVNLFFCLSHPHKRNTVSQKDYNDVFCHSLRGSCFHHVVNFLIVKHDLGIITINWDDMFFFRLNRKKPYMV